MSAFRAIPKRLSGLSGHNYAVTFFFFLSSSFRRKFPQSEMRRVSTLDNLRHCPFYQSFGRDQPLLDKLETKKILQINLLWALCKATSSSYFFFSFVGRKISWLDIVTRIDERGPKITCCLLKWRHGSDVIRCFVIIPQHHIEIWQKEKYRLRYDADWSQDRDSRTKFTSEWNAVTHLRLGLT